jgi:signal transduction histidine kinase
VLQNNQQSIPAPLKAAIIESIRIINGSSKIQLQLVNNVLEWQKLSANKVVVDRSDFDLRKTIHAVAYNFRCLLRLRGLTVDMEVDPAVPLIIRTDQLKIQQILINYLSNAIKYTRENTRISIRAVPASAQQPSDISGKSVVALPLISILVQDQGAGVVGAEQQQQLFRRFAQLTNSLQANGSGIGLSVCQQLAEMLGGRVWYEHPARFWCSFTYEPSPFTGQLDSPVSNELIGYGGIKRKLSDVDIAETAAAAAADLDCPPSKIINSSLQRSAEPEKGSQKLSNQHSSSIDHEKWCPILIVEDNL